MPRARAVNVKDALPPALLAVLARVGWDKVTMDAVARAAGVAVGDARAVAADKYTLLPLVVAWVDGQAAGVDPGGSPRDQAFERIMNKIDVFQAHRAGFTALFRGAWADPRAVVAVAAPVMLAMGDGRGQGARDTGGMPPSYIIKPIALSICYALTLKVWMNDESMDLGGTMAELDRRLGQAERWIT